MTNAPICVIASADSGDARAMGILLSSEESGCGLDYQFCDCLVNYDLPWNPMRIEQRIGRMAFRYGQKKAGSSCHLIW